MTAVFKAKSRGGFDGIESFFNRVLSKNYLNILDRYGKRGVQLLRQATPSHTGKAASSWEYLVEDLGQGRYSLSFINNAEENGYNIVLLNMYGHGTGGGGYVEENDFVNPVIQPLLQEMLIELRKEVVG